MIFQSLDEQLCTEIQQPAIMNNRQDRLTFRKVVSFGRERRPDRTYSYRQRPGLEDLV